MPITTIFALLATYLPTIIDDGVKVTEVLTAAGTAVNNAAANGGVVTDGDWAALDTVTGGDLAALHAAASAPA